MTTLNARRRMPSPGCEGGGGVFFAHPVDYGQLDRTCHGVPAVEKEVGAHDGLTDARVEQEETTAALLCKQQGVRERPARRLHCQLELLEAPACQGLQNTRLLEAVP
jgi:hypothetical protein